MSTRSCWIMGFLLFACVSWMTLRSEPRPSEAAKTFGQLPVLTGGRLKPIDTVARISLLSLRGKQTWKGERGYQPAIEWLMEVIFRPDLADQRKVFRIDHPDVLGLFGWEQGSEKYFSFSELKDHLKEVDRQAQLASQVESSLRTPFQAAIIKLNERVLHYHRLKNSLHTEDSPNFQNEISVYQASLTKGIEAFQKRQENKPFVKEDLELLAEFTNRYDFLTKVAAFFPIPPASEKEGIEHWTSTGDSLLKGSSSGEFHPILLAWARLDSAYRGQSMKEFQSEVDSILAKLYKDFPDHLKKIHYETRFNELQPFYVSLILYLLAFILTWYALMRNQTTLGRVIWALMIFTLILHTWGLLSRMWIQGRPPVTNLYSSAIFIGWAAVILGLLLERFYRNQIGNLTASLVGFLTLLIAHHLTGDGDTLEMMRAVLDSNFWLATHVVVITLGYASTFLAGFLALVYIVLGSFTKRLQADLAKSLYSMVYGIVCFALLFSAVGTILGGIWADQSWGRFWGWDPKENGALLIVIWNAIILHARVAGFVRERGMMVLAVFGNIVTSFSWFGVNMLGVGLHSYGFMDSAFKVLILFMSSQVALMACGLFMPDVKYPAKK